MRSDLVFKAVYYIPNRYELCQLASKATRRLHHPNTRVPDTTNHVLGCLDTSKIDKKIRTGGVEFHQDSYGSLNAV